MNIWNLKPPVIILLLTLIILSFHSCSTKDSHEDLLDQVTFVSSTIKGTPGYFRVGQSANGQWWFITPEGEPFFYRGVCAVNRAGTAGGREAKDGPYAAAVDEKYGYLANPDTFVYAQFERLKDWGFNALGAWTTEEFFDKGMPYTEILEFFYEGPHLQLEGQRRPMPDIFDPLWIQAINRKARTFCSPKLHSKDLVGYFTDNEIGFGNSTDIGLDLGFNNSGRFGYSLLRNVLAFEEGVAARERAWSFIRERYPDMQSLSEAWGQAIKSEEDISLLNKNKTPFTTQAYLDDAKAFQLIWAERYFRLTYETIKRYDPNHLVMGCRFGAPPDSALLRVITPYMDVISQNNYRPTLYQRIDYLYQETGLPVLIGEFSWNPDLFKYVPLLDEPEGGYGVKERVFRRGEEVLLRTASHPATVGYTWYRWVQGTSREDHFTFGLVDYNDSVEMHVPNLELVHPRMVPLRLEMANAPADYFSSNTGTLTLTLEGFRPDWPHLLNFKAENGQWKHKAFGWQMEAEITGGSLTAEGGDIIMKVEFKEWRHRGTVVSNHARGDYQVSIQRDGQYLNGAYSGTYEGEAVKGKVEGYFLPPLPVEFAAGTLF